MDLTYEQTERTCGFLFLNDFNVFTYCCKTCGQEFEFCIQLEEHILMEHQHQDVKSSIENVFVSSGRLESMSGDLSSEVDQKLITIDEIKQEIEAEPAFLQDFEFENSVQSTEYGTLSVFVNEAYDYGMPKSESAEITTDQSNGKRSKRRPMIANRITSTVTKPPRLDPNKYYCDMCPFNEVNFNLKVDLKKHMRGHYACKKLRPCPICNEMIETISSHVKEHHQGVNGKPYKCTYCVRRFAAEYLLMNHIRTHTNERPYLCADCGSAYKTSSALTSHIERIHRSEKKMPYSCTHCDISFLLKHRFEEHRLSVHGDERPHVCDVCSNRFKTTDTLRNHKSTHGERMHTCTFCGKKFKTKDYKRHHERKVHGDIYRGNQRRYYK